MAKSPKKVKPVELIPRSRIRSAVRKLWLWSPMRKEALARARISRGVYRCAECGGTFGPKEIEVDHIQPVGSTRDSWDLQIERLFCPVEGLRILCKGCHSHHTHPKR